jgi:hypothetical protein
MIFKLDSITWHQDSPLDVSVVVVWYQAAVGFGTA